MGSMACPRLSCTRERRRHKRRFPHAPRQGPRNHVTQGGGEAQPETVRYPPDAQKKLQTSKSFKCRVFGGRYLNHSSGEGQKVRKVGITPGGGHTCWVRHSSRLQQPLPSFLIVTLDSTFMNGSARRRGSARKVLWRGRARTENPQACRRPRQGGRTPGPSRARRRCCQLARPPSSTRGSGSST